MTQAARQLAFESTAKFDSSLTLACVFAIFCRLRVLLNLILLLLVKLIDDYDGSLRVLLNLILLLLEDLRLDRFYCLRVLHFSN